MLIQEAENTIENGLQQAYSSEMLINALAATALCEKPSLPQSVQEVLNDKNWRDAIDR